MLKNWYQSGIYLLGWRNVCRRWNQTLVKAYKRLSNCGKDKHAKEYMVQKPQCTSVGKDMRQIQYTHGD